MNHICLVRLVVLKRPAFQSRKYGMPVYVLCFQNALQQQLQSVSTLLSNGLPIATVMCKHPAFEATPNSNCNVQALYFRMGPHQQLYRTREVGDDASLQLFNFNVLLALSSQVSVFLKLFIMNSVWTYREPFDNLCYVSHAVVSGTHPCVAGRTGRRPRESKAGGHPKIEITKIQML